MKKSGYRLQINFVFFLIMSWGSLFAGLSPRVFKNVSACFKPGFENYSPILGSAALTSGLIENVRFFNVDPGAPKDSGREYIDDAPPANDHAMKLIKMLFPSPAGQLTTETNHSSSFGKSCTTIEQMAALVNYAYAIRSGIENDNNYLKKDADSSTYLSIPDLWNKIKTTTDTADIFDKKPFTEKKKNIPVHELFLAIAQAIEDEIRSKKANPDTPGFYPEYFVEQILLAFFCHKVTDQKDLSDFLGNLHDNIVDKAQISNVSGFLNKEDIQPALDRVTADNANLDDCWIILNRDIFTRLIPYTSGKNPISNGLAKKYQRHSNKEGTESFADCVEVTLRHIINFLLYNPETTTFDLTTLEAHMLGKNQTYLPNLKAFYAQQPPDKADAGDPVIRSLWNKVVADLGHNIRYRQKFESKDKIQTNELDTGILNMIRVFKTIFDLDLNDDLKIIASQEEQFKEQVKALFTDCFKKLCLALNQNIDCTISYDGTAIDASRADLTGNIGISITKKSDNSKLFDFSIRVLGYHIDIQNLNIAQNDAFVIEQETITKIQEGLLAEPRAKTTIPSLLQIDTTLIKPTAVGMQSQPFAGQFRGDNLEKIAHTYLLFGEPLNDSNSYATAIRGVSFLYKTKKYIDKNLAERVLKNVLRVFPWDDKASLERLIEVTISPNFIIDNLMSSDLSPIFMSETKGILLNATSYDIFSPILENFKNCSFLFDTYSQQHQLDLSQLTKIKEINIEYEQSRWRTANGIILSIKFPNPAPQFESVSTSLIRKITTLDLSQCPNIKKIDCVTNLLLLPATIKYLEHICLPKYPKSSDFKLPAGLNLQEIYFPQLFGGSSVDAYGPKTIEFTGPMPKLKTLKINQGVKKIIGLEYCPQLDRSTIPASVTIIEKNELEKKLIALTFSLEKLKTQLKTLSSKLGDLKRGLIT